jgi:hypothetical protein
MNPIQDSILQLLNEALANSAGAFSHTGNYDINGTLTADTIKVKHLVTEDGAIKFGTWVTQLEEDLNGKGFSWSWGDGATQLIYRSGNRLYNSGSFDVPNGQSYKIDNVAVLSANELGVTVTKSKLREVGTLKSLSVSGDTVLSDFATFNSSLNRLGLNTDEPNGVLSIVENDVEVIIASQRIGEAVFGTYTTHDLKIITDNTAHITVKSSGEVVFGNPVTKTANVTIYGSLKVDNLVSDTRINRYSSLEFHSSRDQSEYGQGLVWVNGSTEKSLVLRADPNRVWTSESFEVGPDQSYYADGQQVLSKTQLGNSVHTSNLSKVGTLESLSVQGQTTFFGDINASRSTMLAKVVRFDEGVDHLEISGSGLQASKISIKAGGDETYYADVNEITIGNKENTRRPVKVFGQLAVGVNHPDPNVGLAVRGGIAFSNKKFVYGTNIPTEGSWAKGDICWNENPTEGNYVGWVCITAGGPGEWLPFGAINRQ